MALVVVGVAIGACGSDETLTEPVNDILPFVGTWEAEVFTFTSESVPAVVADMMLDGSFTFNVQPSGNYTSTFVFGGIPSVEFGSMSVSGNILTFSPQSGRSATSTFSFTSPDYLVVDGQREFDFNLDGTLDPSTMHQELRRNQP
jgi:hypothetical protein